MIAALVVVLALSLAPHEKLERRLAHWKPDKVWPNPPARKLIADVNLEGKWHWSSGMDGGADLYFQRTGKDVYAVTFYAHGCADHWTLRRTAKVSGGAIVLNRAVEDYVGYTYNRLFAVHFKGALKLLPAPVYYHEIALIRWLDYIAFSKAASMDARPVIEP